MSRDRQVRVLGVVVGSGDVSSCLVPVVRPVSEILFSLNFHDLIVFLIFSVIMNFLILYVRRKTGHVHRDPETTKQI